MTLQQQTALRLRESVGMAIEWLAELPNDTIRFRPTPDRWSIAEVMGHLIDSACNNHQRFIRAQESESLVFPKYDQNSWAAKGFYHDSPWLEIVSLWKLYNHQMARIIERIPGHQLDTVCTIEPFEPCTLEFLMTDYVDHLDHHLTKIRERIA